MMNVTCDREKLLVACQAASSVVPARSAKPILLNFKIEAIAEKTTLLATDLEVGIRIDVPGIEVQQPGQAVLPAARLNAILRESSDEIIRLSADLKGTEIRGERSRFKLPGADPGEFPDVALFEETAYHEVPARLLRQLIHRTVFATDPESTRYALGGVLLEMDDTKIIAIGTDGRRLAKMEGPAQSVGGHKTGDQATIIPSKAMHLIDRVITDSDAEVRLAVSSSHALISSQRVTIYSRLVEGRFPKWRDVFPQRHNAARITVPVGPLNSAVRQAAIVTSQESRGVDFGFAEGSLTLKSQSAEHGQSQIELPIAYAGEPISIMLDPRYLIDFLKVLDAEKTFTLEVQDGESAVVCTTDDGYAYVIMPLARDAK